jgi:GNAT superfamily N-acetyltransferase
VIIRNTLAEDIRPIIRLCRETYTEAWPWYGGQLESHLELFPEGQFVAVDPDRANAVIGMAASLIVRWADYPMHARWQEFTDHGHFSNHDPVHGDTLYGAEIMVHPAYQGKGVGKLLYRAREELLRRLGLQAIRAGARISGYRDYLEKQDAGATPEEYVRRVVAGELRDPTLSFQLKHGFRVLTIVPQYFHDPASLDHAALIEWTPTKLQPSTPEPA